MGYNSIDLRFCLVGSGNIYGLTSCYKSVSKNSIRMRTSLALLTLFVLFLVSTKTVVNGQLSFGGDNDDDKKDDSATSSDENVAGDVNPRLGFVATSLGDSKGGGSNGQQISQQNVNPNGRNGQACCCAAGNFCPNPRDFEDGGFLDNIDPRLKVEATKSSRRKRQEIDPFDISTRIVNSPPSQPSTQTCPRGSRTCCYTQEEVSLFGNNCVPLSNNNNPNVFWEQGCNDNIRNFNSGKTCGQRSFRTLSSLSEGQASPDEFPWTCLVLTTENKFLGGCAIVPERKDNDISSGTSRVITAAHKLKLEANEGLKVRIIEYDASDFNPNVENDQHQEILVSRFIKHPNFNPKRLSDDIAVLQLRSKINLRSSNGVNAACYPSCNDMFDYTFNNGTGVRCWVAGWGRNDEKSQGGKFSFIQRKVDVPIYHDRSRCEQRLREALGGSRNFNLHPGELCAGGVEKKDACDGDGGSPLVCQSKRGKWTVVGLVAWGVGCGKPDVPGVYVNIHHYLDFITSPR